jgi:transcriptional regulator with XRE-family HTH domain
MGSAREDVGATFGRRIQALRRGLGLTQRQVADRLRIDFTYLSKLENDRGDKPSEETVRGLADVLQTDLEELLALAGRIPKELRERASSDPQFATFLRRVARMSPAELNKQYKTAGIDPKKKRR